jgi:replicative DNA helicase
MNIYIRSTLFIPFANAEDIFNGTILFKNNDWHFVRYSITQDDYLIEAHQEIFTQFKELQQNKKTIGSVYWQKLKLRTAEWEFNFKN